MKLSLFYHWVADIFYSFKSFSSGDEFRRKAFVQEGKEENLRLDIRKPNDKLKL